MTSSYPAPPPLYLQASSTTDTSHNAYLRQSSQESQESFEGLSDPSTTATTTATSADPSGAASAGYYHHELPQHHHLPDDAYDVHQHHQHQHQHYMMLPSNTLSSAAHFPGGGGGGAPSQSSPASGASAASSSSGTSSSQRTFTPGEEGDAAGPSHHAASGVAQQHHVNNSSSAAGKVGGDDDFSQTFYDPFRVKHRRRTTPQQLQILEHHFEHNSKPDVNLRKALSDQLEMTPREVQVWFQNRRAKVKKLREKAEKEGTDPNLVGIARASSDDSSPVEANFPHIDPSVRVSNHHQYQLPPAGSLAPNNVDLSVRAPGDHDSDPNRRRGSFATNYSSSTTPPEVYYDPSPMTTASNALYPPPPVQPHPTNGYGHPMGSGYPTPNSLNTPSHSPHDLLHPSNDYTSAGGRTDGMSDQGYHAAQGGARRFSLPAYGGGPEQPSFNPSWEAVSHVNGAYATPPIDPHTMQLYREHDYMSQRDDDEYSESPDDPTDSYSFTSHLQPSTSSFHLPMDPNAKGSHVGLTNGQGDVRGVHDRRGSFPNLNQAFDTLNFAPSATSISTGGTATMATTSPTRIGGIAAPQWPIGATSRLAYAAPSFAPSSSGEYVYGSSPIATPPVNYFPTVNRVGVSGPSGRRGSLHSIPERGNFNPAFVDPSATISAPNHSSSSSAPVDPNQQGGWLGAPISSSALSERRGSNASIARKARSSNSLRAPYPNQDSRNRSPTAASAFAPGPGVDARVVPDGMQYVLPNASTAVTDQPMDQQQ